MTDDDLERFERRMLLAGVALAAIGFVCAAGIGAYMTQFMR